MTKIIHCHNEFCIYCKNDKCLLDNITLDILGNCKECIYVNISKEILSQYKKTDH